MQDNRVNLKITKAEVLDFLTEKGFIVPKGYFFTVRQWRNNPGDIISTLLSCFGEDFLAVRSSSQAEDTELSSMAGVYCSLLNVKKSSRALKASIEEVIKSFSINGNNIDDDQILIQPMVSDVVMSGVAMSKVLDDGSPYYVINFDDSSGRTDSVTSGHTVNKTVYIYNGAKDTDFDSSKLRNIVNTMKELEKLFVNLPLDVEFAIDKNETLYILQVRRICSTANWDKRVNTAVSEQIEFISEYIERLMQPRYELFGEKTILGVMPDWNPAEMIGIVPRPLATSLYRKLITDNVWCIARKMMGYRQMPSTPLMVKVSGHSYIDVRTSFNSFLPNGITDSISEKLVNAWIERLDSNPQLHDKIEFEIVSTVLDFNFRTFFKEHYPDLLTDGEFSQYEGALRTLTSNAFNEKPYTSLDRALSSISRLESLQKSLPYNEDEDIFITADRISAMLDECVNYGTIPFAVAARHGFIAESLLRSAISREAISEERVSALKTGIYTITKEMSDDFYNVYSGNMSKDLFLEKYGHLRPSSYDILSPCYRNRANLFDGKPLNTDKHPDFSPTPQEIKDTGALLSEAGFANASAVKIFEYAKKAIRAREYVKFVFTRHLSCILENAAKWGEFFGFSREDISLLPVEQITNIVHTSLPKNTKNYMKDMIDKARDEYDLAQSFKLSYLIRSSRDVYVVPQQRTAPNFISRKNIEAGIRFLSPDTDTNTDLSGSIVCIEGADPGYDWIFSRNIAGLVTKFGGANSHMAIRCAEYDLPAAIGCGEQTFERVIQAKACILNCAEKKLTPVNVRGEL